MLHTHTQHSTPQCCNTSLNISMLHTHHSTPQCCYTLLLNTSMLQHITQHLNAATHHSTPQCCNTSLNTSMLQHINQHLNAATHHSTPQCCNTSLNISMLQQITELCSAAHTLCNTSDYAANTSFNTLMLHAYHSTVHCCTHHTSQITLLTRQSTAQCCTYITQHQNKAKTSLKISALHIHHSTSK